MSRASQSPPALKTAGALFLAGIWAPAIFDHGDAPASTLIGAFLVMALVVFIMLRASRIAWTLVLIVVAIGVVGVTLNGSWWDVLLRLLPLPFLLAPESRRYIWNR
ncbi:MAG TPA: hypothetical protein VFX45_10800 [Solirubrobacterales bacterium]|nr:hypothetical protein [Solirubrobacterales bacterium]